VTFPARWSAAAYLLVVFLSGVVVGGLAYRLYSVKAVASSTERPRMTPQEYRKKAIREMTGRLRLTAEQVQGLERIMDETRKRYRDAHQNVISPQIKAIEEEQHEKIRALLNDSQRDEYGKMLAERAQRRRQGK